MAVTTPASARGATRVGVRHALRPQPGTALLGALVAACMYAVFAHGGVGLPEEPRLQIGIALVSIGAAIGWLSSRALSLRAPAEAWIGVGLLLGFAVWCGVTLLWSVAPDNTWAQANRSIAYALVAVLAIAVGSSAPKAIERVATGWLVVAVVCALYALGGKLIPGAEILGVSFDHTAFASRLREPLQYWNALGLVCVLAVPIALRMTTDVARRPAVRCAALAALFALLTCLGMTYSRGGILALMVAVFVMTLLGGQRLRGLAVFATTLVFLIPVLALAFSRPALKGINVPLDDRTPDGIILCLVMAGSLVGLLIAAWGLLRLEERAKWSEESTRLVWRGLATTVGVFALVIVLGIATSKGGPGQFFDDAWHEFTKTSQDKDSDPNRIISSNSGNRWVWWKEAAGAWTDKPVGGWGAGSFGVTHLLYREVELDVQQPHNVPLQFLAETGIVGAVLGMGALAFLLFAALARVRGMAEGRERDIAVALFAAAVAWLVHGVVDFDWDIPGVTIPALVFMGVLAAIPARRETPSALSPAAASAAPRVAALVVVCLALGLVIVSALLPVLADSKATSSLAVTTQAAEPELQRAAAEAETGARLDPTSVASLLAAADLAQNRGRLVDARRYLLQAVERQPYSVVAWRRLMQLALVTADRRGAKAAAERLLELDPIGKGTLALVGQLVLFSVPANGSPTATGTPLTPAYTSAPATTTPTPQAGGPAAGIPQTAVPGAAGATGTTGEAIPGAVAPPPPPPPAAKDAKPG